MKIYKLRATKTAYSIDEVDKNWKVVWDKWSAWKKIVNIIRNLWVKKSNDLLKNYTWDDPQSFLSENLEKTLELALNADEDVSWETQKERCYFRFYEKEEDSFDWNPEINEVFLEESLKEPIKWIKNLFFVDWWILKWQAYLDWLLKIIVLNKNKSEVLKRIVDKATFVWISVWDDDMWYQEDDILTEVSFSDEDTNWDFFTVENKFNKEEVSIDESFKRIKKLSTSA